MNGKATNTTLGSVFGPITSIHCITHDDMLQHYPEQ